MIKIIAIGTKMPHWIDEGIKHYQKQLKNFEIIAIKNSNKIEENKHLLQKMSGFVIALDEKGEGFSSMNFAKNFEKWQEFKDMSFIIGGADGLTDEVRNKANILVSLSKMTLPHSLARLVLVEQIYRATAILKNHPYHREG